MIDKVLTKVFGTKHERDVKKLLPRVAASTPSSPPSRRSPTRSCAGRPPSSAPARRSDGEGRRCGKKEQKDARAKILDELLEQAFAVVREASGRALGMRHFDVQLIGGMVLHQGKIAEMRTGEGKTLVATLPVYLNALAGKGVHVVTVNDYLARRDADWMGRIYRFLGLTVGVIQHGLLDDGAAGRPTAATSPTARTTSSASTTCATT